MNLEKVLMFFENFDKYQVAGLIIVLLLVMIYIVVNSDGQKEKEDEYLLKDAELRKVLKRQEVKSSVVRYALIGVILTLLSINASYFFTAISVISAGIAIAMREEIADFFIGFLVRTKMVPLSIEVGSVIVLDDDPRAQALDIVKVNGFKTILLNRATNEYISLRNTYLFRNKVKHVVVEKIYNIDCVSIVDVETNMYELEKLLIAKMDNLLSVGEIATADNTTLADIKLEYGAFPKLTSGFNILYEQNAIGEIKVKVSFNTHANGRTKSDISRKFFKEIMAITQNYARKKVEKKEEVEPEEKKS